MATDQFGGTLVQTTDSFGGTLVDAEPPPKTSAVRKLGDLGLSALRGAIAVPEAAVGLADIATGGQAGKAAERLGFRPKEAKEFLAGYYSDDLKAKQAKFQEADGVLDKVGVAVTNPSLIANTVAESAAPMLAGGVAARGVRALGAGAVGAGAAGEGIVGAGSAAEAIRQETPDGTLTPGQSALALGSGTATGLIGYGGGKVAQKLGIGDIDTMIAQGGRQVATGAPKGIVRRAAEGAASEGLLEELPQSVSEQVIQNVALDKPLSEGVVDQAVMGTLAGGVMGAGAGALAKPVTKSEAMGINPADGPLSRSAAVAVDSGLTDQVQAVQVAQQQEEQAGKEGKKPEEKNDAQIQSPLATAASLGVDQTADQGAPAGDVAPLGSAPPSAAPAVESGTLPGASGDTSPDGVLESAPVAPRGQFTTYDDAKEYIRQQRRAGGTRIEALPLPMEDGSFGLATRNSPEYTRAEFHAKQQAQRVAGILDGDVLSKAGEPFKNRLAAGNALRKAGAGHVIEPVQGGFVVRKGAIDVSMPSGPGGVAAGDGGPAVAEQRGGLADAGRAPDSTARAVAQPAGVAAPAGQPDLAARDAGGPADAVAAPQPPLQAKPLTRATREGIARMAPDEVQAAFDGAVAHNNAVDLDVVKQLRGDAFAEEFAQWSRRKRERWMQENLTAQQDDVVQQAYMDEELIKEYVGAAGDFDDTGPAELGRSIMARVKDMDRPGWEHSRDGVTVRAALDYATEKGWSESVVLGAVRARISQVYGDDAKELFPKFFERKARKPAAAPAPQVISTTAQQPQEQPRATETPEAQPRAPRSEEAPRAEVRTGQPASAPALARNAQARPQATALSPLESEIDRDLEQAYQQDVKNGIKAKRGMLPQPKEAKAKQSPLRSFLREAGIDPKLAADITGERGLRANQRLPGTFRKGGKQLDELVTLARERGFISDADIESAKDTGGTGRLVEMIQAELRGDVQQSAETADQAAERAAAERASSELERQAKAVGFDTTGLSEDQVATAVQRIERRREVARVRRDAFDLKQEAAIERAAIQAPALTDEQWSALDVAIDAADNASTEDVMRDLGFSEQEISDETAKRSKGTPEGGEVRGRADEPAASRPQGSAEARTRDQGREEGLTSPTRADIEARQDRTARVEREQSQADKESERRASADAQRAEFTLTGSDRAADANAAQTDIFAAAPADSKEAKGASETPKSGSEPAKPASKAQKSESPGKQVSREIGQRGEGMSEFRAKQVRNELAKKNPGIDYTVEEDTALKNGFAVVGRKAEKPAFKRSETQVASDTHLVQLQQRVEEIAGRWENAPEIIVARNMQDQAIPQRVRAYDQLQQAQGATGAPQGFIYGGKVYLLADQLTDPARAQTVLFHESLGHFGLRGVFGDALKPILQQIATMRRADVDAKAKAYGLDPNDPADRLYAAEEVLAEMAQARPEIGFVQRAVAAIRNWLRAHGFAKLGLTDNDIIQGYILPARGWVERGRAADGSEPGAAQAAFARPKAADAKAIDADYLAAVERNDMATAQRMVDDAARSAGYGGGIEYRMSHTAPDRDSGSALTDLRDADLVPKDYWTHPHWYQGTTEERESFSKVSSLFRAMDSRGEAGKTPGLAAMTVYRAVPKNVKEKAFRNGDWVTPSEAYAKQEGAMIPGGYRIIAMQAAAKNLWWDGNSIAELGYDNGQTYAYQNTRNNRKKLDAVTRDTEGNVIPLSKRFNTRSDDPNFSRAGAAPTPGNTIPKGMAYGDLTQDQEAALRKVAGFTAPPTLKERAQAMKANLGAKMVQGIFDQFAPIKNVSPQAYMQARLSKGSDGTMEAAMLYGKPFLRDGVPDVDVKDGGFGQVLANLKGEHDRFLMWVAAQRAQRLKTEGKENLFSDADISTLTTLNAGKMADGTARPMVYAKALADLNAFNDSVLQMAVESGLIDQEARDLFKGQPYVPFYRVMEEGMTGPRFSSGLVNQQAFKKLKGGTNQLNADLLENMLLNWSHLYSAAARNRAAVATMDAADKMAVAYKVPAETKGAVKVMREGVAEHWAVEDPYLLEAISALNYAPSPLMKPLAKMKNVLTYTITVNPTFKIRNLIRDSLSAISQADLSYNPLKNVTSGWKATSRDSQIAASMLASGGTIKFGTQEDSARVRKQIENLGGTMLDKEGFSKLADQVKTLWGAYEEFGDRTENVNRAALYEQLIAKGKTHAEASFMARDLMDFSMSGRWELVRFLGQTVPFMNARLQGLYKLGRAAKEDPRRFGTMAAAVALASLGLLGAYGDDDDWKQREDWDRDAYWWFKIGSTAFRIPKPFELGAIGTVAERTAELMLDKEMTTQRFGKRIADMVFGTFAMDPTPQFVKPLLDIYSNKDSFTGRPIEGISDERLRPEDRMNERTSEVARLLGGWGLPDPVKLAKGDYSALSPKQVDFLLRGYFGWVGTTAASLSDRVVRPMMDRGERPAMELKDTFLAGNFVETLPRSGSRYVTQLYEQSRDVEQAYASWRDALKRGDTEKASEIREAEGSKLKNRITIEHAKKQVAKLNNQARMVEASKTLSAEQKRERLEQIDAQRDAAARRAVPA